MFLIRGVLAQSDVWIKLQLQHKLSSRIGGISCISINIRTWIFLIIEGEALIEVGAAAEKANQTRR